MSDGKARILLWGIEGSGKSTTLATIHEKLRADLRGEIRQEPTRLDPTVFSESLLIKLGGAGDLENQIELTAVPGSPDQGMSRKQLLDGVDGLVLLLDCSPDRIEMNAAILQELQASLSDYGHSLTDLPIVLQYNKRDIADPFAIEDLHRRIGLTQSAVFETIATTGHGIMATLTTISKHVVRARKGPLTSTPADASPVSTVDASPTAQAGSLHSPTPTPTPTTAQSAATPAASPDSVHEMLEAAILADGEDGETAQFIDAVPEFAKPETELGLRLQIVSVGEAQVNAEQTIELPIVLGDENGQTRSVRLSLRIDSILGDGRD